MGVRGRARTPRAPTFKDDQGGWGQSWAAEESWVQASGAAHHPHHIRAAGWGPLGAPGAEMVWLQRVRGQCGAGGGATQGGLAAHTEGPWERRRRGCRDPPLNASSSCVGEATHHWAVWGLLAGWTGRPQGCPGLEVKSGP